MSRTPGGPGADHPSMSPERGVLDATYSALFDNYLRGAVEAATFRRQFYSTMVSDARLGDEVRYAILQRVFFGLEDLVLDGDLPDGQGRDDDEIDEPEFREIVAEAADDLKHRPDDWEGDHSVRHGTSPANRTEDQ